MATTNTNNPSQNPLARPLAAPPAAGKPGEPKAATDPAKIAKDEADLRENAKNAKSQFENILSGTGLGKLMNFFGRPGSPEQQAANTLLNSMTNGAFYPDTYKGKISDLKSYDGTAATVKHNMAAVLDYELQSGKIFFDKDPAKNIEIFKKFKAEIAESVDQAMPKSGSVNMDAVNRSVRQIAAKHGAHYVVSHGEDNKPLVPAARVESANIQYGPAVAGKDIPLKGRFAVNTLDEGGHLDSAGNMTLAKLQETLGPDFRLQVIYQGDTALSVDGKPPGMYATGYYASNAKGEGFVLPDPIDPHKLQANDAYNKLMTKPEAPKPAAAEPAPAHAPVVAQDFHQQWKPQDMAFKV